MLNKFRHKFTNNYIYSYYTQYDFDLIRFPSLKFSFPKFPNKSHYNYNRSI